jgi:hypothetical protein
VLFSGIPLSCFFWLCTFQFLQSLSRVHDTAFASTLIYKHRINDVMIV